jgi:hypothetical protein
VTAPASARIPSLLASLRRHIDVARSEVYQPGDEYQPRWSRTIDSLDGALEDLAELARALDVAP